MLTTILKRKSIKQATSTSVYYKMIKAKSLIFTTPFGYAGLIFRTEPFAVVKVFLPRLYKENLVETIGVQGTVETGFHKKAVFIKQSIIDYFKGKPINIPPALLDMKTLTGLEQSVLYATAKIEYGKLKTYKEIAELIHRPRASRFVGNALAKNPFPVLIPCHRVIRSDGSYGKFGGGPDLKRKMIELEATNCLP